MVGGIVNLHYSVSYVIILQSGNSIELLPNTNLNAKRTLSALYGDYRTDQDTRELGLHQSPYEMSYV